MSVPTSINADFKASPYFYARLFVASLIQVLKTTMPAVDWQSRYTHQANDYESQGLLSLLWSRTQVEWDAIVTGPGQNRPLPRRAHGIENPIELGWAVGATDLEIAINKADVKHQTAICDKLPEVKKELLALALSQCPSTFVTTYQNLPLAQQTMSRLIDDIIARYYSVPPDQIVLMQARMHEPWIATQDPREFALRLKSFRDAMSPIYQAAHGDVVLIQILIDALRNHPSLQQHIREELHRTRPHDFESFLYDDASDIWVRFILMDRDNGTYTTIHAAVEQAPVQGPVQDSSVNSTIGELTAAVHSLQATVHAMNTTSQFQGRGGRGMQGRNYQAPQGRGNQGRAQQGRAGTQGRGQGRAQGRGRGGNAGGLFCFWHHYNSTHATVDCYYCNMYYPPVSFPNVYTITRPGQINAPGGVILVSGGGSNN